MLNVTRKYITSYSHLDNWEFIGQVEYFKSDDYGDESYDEDESVRQDNLVIVYLAESHTREEAESALRDMARKGCNCEHDCCGHYFGGISSNFTWLDSSTVRFTSTYQRNY
jgi:hypothetical protein